ncbi:MAG: signal peptidase II [Treponema sp.]|nr:signal peptidase II [Treponema sp.]
MEKNLKNKLLPFILTVAVIILDQITKMIVVSKIPEYTIGCEFFGDFLRLIHVRNTGVAFSMGASWGQSIRRIMFLLVPVIVIGLVISVYFRNNDFTNLQRWAITGIIGGGLGNLIDRFFRPAGVVDFIDVKFYGLFGLDRWPTFNVADSAVVVCGIILLISFIVSIIKEEKNKKQTKQEGE